MKGIVLAGGSGTRLRPLTLVTSKQLLPVYDKPMICYPIETLISSGIKEILIIVSPERQGDFQRLVDSVLYAGVSLAILTQEKPEGIAQALLIAEEFVGDNNVALVLGDNIFEFNFRDTIANFKGGAEIFIKDVENPERFGVARFDDASRIVEIVEKPKTYISSSAITGLYLFDGVAVEVARKLTPSARGELEIVDVINDYLRRGVLGYTKISGEWFDAGTIESLFAVGEWARSRSLSGRHEQIS